MSEGNDLDNLLMCPQCSDEAGYPVFWHKSHFRAGRRNCLMCETFEELQRAERLKSLGVAWKPDHGPKPLVSDEERYGGN
jgi:hypothetical protein